MTIHGDPGPTARRRDAPGGVGTAGVRAHLVRHGESVWNACGLLQGRTGHVPLSRVGLEQSLRTAGVLGHHPVGQIWSSDQLRCLQTAEIIAAWHQLPVRRSPMLREQCHGVWEGTAVADQAAWLARAGPDWAPAGGETARELHARAVRFVRTLTGLLAGRGDDRSEVVVVTHGETIRALAAAVRGVEVERMPAVVPGNGSLSSVMLAVTVGTDEAPVTGRPGRRKVRGRTQPIR